MTAISTLYKDSLPPGVTGQTTVGTSAAQVKNLPVELATGVLLKAIVGNTGIIYVGFNASVTAANGFPLNPGDTIPLSIDSLEKVWIIGSAAGQVLAWIAQ